MATRRRSSIWSGWIAFAATMMIVVGMLNVLEGIITIVFRDRTVVVAGRLYVVSVLGWGVLILAFGVLLTCAGIGVASGRTWARVVAIVCVCLHAIVQIASLAAYPLWSLLMLALDVVVLYVLTAAWRDATAAHDQLTRPNARDEQAMWEQHPRTVA